MMGLMGDMQLLPLVFSYVLMVPLFLLWAWVALREVFRLNWVRSLVALAGGAFALMLASPVLPYLGVVLGSPFLLLLLFFVVRSYFVEAQRAQSARAAFRQNLEAATLNPADASAHYNLGLLHAQRKEFDERSEEHTSELQSRQYLVCRLLLEKKK